MLIIAGNLLYSESLRRRDCLTLRKIIIRKAPDEFARKVTSRVLCLLDVSGPPQRRLFICRYLELFYIGDHGFVTVVREAGM
jgi:hypothetical protein